MIGGFAANAARLTRSNLSVLAANSFFRGAHNSIYSVIWQPYVLSLGASMPTLGLLNSLGGMGGIVTTVIQSLGGWLADRVGRKPFIIASSFAVIIAYTLFALSGWLNIWVLLLIGVIALGASALSRPAITSMTAESVKEERRGTAFSLMMVASIVPGVIAPALGGWVADRFGYTSLFPIFILIEAPALFLVWRYLYETRVVDGAAIQWREAVRALVRSIIPPKSLVGFFCACAVDSFSWGMGWTLIFGMITDQYHFSAEQLGIMASAVSLTWAISQMPIGRYIDKRGTKVMLIFSELLGIPVMLLGITQSRFEIFVVAHVIFALTAATWIPTINTHLSRCVSDAERGETFGRLNAFKGLISFPSPAIGGLLYTWGGIGAPLTANLIGILMVVTIMYFFVKEPPIAARG